MGVSGVASDAVDRVGGVDEDGSFLDAFNQVFLLCRCFFFGINLHTEVYSIIYLSLKCMKWGMIENQIKTVLLLGALTGLFLWVGQLMGGAQGLLFALVFVVLMNGVSYWFSDKIVLAMYRARELSKSEDRQLFAMVEGLAKEAKLPMPKLYRIDSATPNAFATGRNPKHAAIAVTTAIESLLTKDELRGVLAHELSHIKNRDTLIATIAATIAGVISYVASMARWAAIFGDRDDHSGLELLVLAIVTPLMALIIQLAISRSREYLADATGAKLAKDPKALASALKKLQYGNKARPMRGNASAASLFIVNPFSGQALFSLLSTHPPLEKRVEKLEQMKV